MTYSINATHDPARRSWIGAANEPGCEFPIQNLPFGVVRSPGGRTGGAVAIGDQVLDIGCCLEAGLFTGAAAEAAASCAQQTLNAFLALGRGHWSALRSRVSELLSAEIEELRDNP